MPRTLHPEHHRIDRIGWLRAAVLGANDGIVSTASLMIGVAASEAGRQGLLLAGIAGLVAGAMSMAAGEYVSVSSQSETERADLARERREQVQQPDVELKELAAIYEGRGVSPALALQVARELMAHDAVGAHARDELGISSATSARPVQAAVTSALTFAAGALLPLVTAVLAPASQAALMIGVTSLASLVVLGALSARVGGASVPKAVARVAFWGLLAMGFTAVVGRWFGAVVG